VRLALIGFMGSGKSTVAKYLSRLLQLACIEMDELVFERTNSLNMHEVFAKGGEPLLRSTERALMLEYAARANIVLATGGGIIVSPGILDPFKQQGGRAVFLDAPFEQIAKRLVGDDTRPLFRDRLQARRLYDQRLPIYHQLADLRIDATHSSPEQIANLIVEKLHGL